MTHLGQSTVAILLIFACCKKADDTVSAPFGYLDDSKLDQLRATCPMPPDVMTVGDDRPNIAGLAYTCSWREPSDGPWNSVTISARKKDRRIEGINLVTKDRAVATRVFERFVGLVLPPAARDELRRTLDHEDNQIHLESKGGRLFKDDDGRGRINWSFVAYVPSR